MQSYPHNIPIKLFAWLLIGLMSSLGASQPFVLCFESDGRVVLEVECEPGINATNIYPEESIFQAVQENNCFDCIDSDMEDITRNRISKADQLVQLIAAQSIAVSLIGLPERKPITSFQSATDPRPTRLALKTVILLV